jgi:hypothetical protein
MPGQAYLLDRPRDFPRHLAGRLHLIVAAAELGRRVVGVAVEAVVIDQFQEAHLRYISIQRN